jgi:hypothetical protein
MNQKPLVTSESKIPDEGEAVFANDCTNEGASSQTGRATLTNFYQRALETKVAMSLTMRN